MNQFWKLRANVLKSLKRNLAMMQLYMAQFSFNSFLIFSVCFIGRRSFDCFCFLLKNLLAFQHIVINITREDFYKAISNFNYFIYDRAKEINIVRDDN